MKRLLIALLLFLTACSAPIGAPNVPYLTPAPSSVPSAASLSPCPFTSQYFARVMPFPKTSNAFQIYVPGGIHANTGFPATLFLQRILNANSWTHDTEYITMSAAWMSAMAALNGSSWKYLHSASDGTFFNGNKLGVDTFPNNILLITARKYRAGECWDEVAAAPYTPGNQSILTGLPSYELGSQTNMKYNTWPAVAENGSEYIPLLYKGDSAIGGLWLEDLYLTPLNGTHDAVNAALGLRLHTLAEVSSTKIETMPNGSIVTMITLSDDGAWANVAAADGQSGWASLEYLEAK